MAEKLHFYRFLANNKFYVSSNQEKFHHNPITDRKVMARKVFGMGWKEF